jgi:hypothetical protein
MERSSFIKYTAAAGAALMLHPFALFANNAGKKIKLAQVGTGHRGTGFWGKDLMTNFEDVMVVEIFECRKEYLPIQMTILII